MDTSARDTLIYIKTNRNRHTNERMEGYASAYSYTVTLVWADRHALTHARTHTHL